jgi:uncharacterized protein (DUF305 family)
MKNKTLLYTFGGLVVGIVVGMLIGTLCHRGMVKNNQASDSLDQHFITEMIPHHEGAIVMAQLALSMSKRPEILSLANGIIEAQNKEIDDMQTWYSSWFGQAPHNHDGMTMEHMDGMEGDLEKLKTANNFDQEFIRQMIPHHEMAVMMARMLEAGTTRNEMKILADQIVSSQTREIDMMRSWAKAWSIQ